MPVYKRIMPEATTSAGEPAPEIPFDPSTTVQLRVPAGQQVFYVYDEHDPTMLVGIRFAPAGADLNAEDS